MGGKGISMKKTTNAALNNNIVANLTQPVFYDDGGVGVTAGANYNCYFHNENGGGNYGAGVFGGGSPVSWPTWQTTWGADANGITNDALFLNYSSGDFHLTASSPTIAAGVNLSSIFTTDKDVVTRPASAGWAIGPYEYAAEVPMPPASMAINPPRNYRRFGGLSGRP